MRPSLTKYFFHLLFAVFHLFQPSIVVSLTAHLYLAHHGIAVSVRLHLTTLLSALSLLSLHPHYAPTAVIAKPRKKINSMVLS